MSEPVVETSVNPSKRKQQDSLNSETILKKRKLFEEEIQKTAASFRSRRNCRQPQRYRPEDFADDEKDLDDDTYGDDVDDMKVLEAEEEKYLQELEELEKEENADGETVIVTDNDVIHQEEEEAAKQFAKDEMEELKNNTMEDMDDDDDDDDEELDTLVLQSLDNDEDTKSDGNGNESDGGNDTDILPTTTTTNEIVVAADSPAMSQNPVETVETLAVPAPGLQNDVAAPLPEEQ